MATPDRLFVVVGTGTAVGKTWLAARLLEHMCQQGWRVAVRKPAQSYAPGEVTDAEVLARMTGETPEQVCPRHRWFERPLAPPIAAESLGLPAFTVADLAADLLWPDAVDIGLIEGAGGVRSPLAGDGDIVDLIFQVDPDLVVLVAAADLGTLNVVRMSVDALGQHPVVVFLNRFDESEDVHRRNRQWLETRMGVTVEIDPIQLSERMLNSDRPLRDR